MWPQWCRLAALTGGCALAACSFDTKPIPPSKLTPSVITHAGTGASAGEDPPQSGKGGDNGGAQAGSGRAGNGGTSGRAPEAGRAGSNAGAAGSGTGGVGGRSGEAGRGGASGASPAEFCQRPANDGLACDDGRFCTTDETCQGGVCKGGAPTDCSALGGDTCNAGTCDPVLDTCIPKPRPDGTACFDALTCTPQGVCMQGVCTATQCTMGGTCEVHCPLGCDCGRLNCVSADDCWAHCGASPCEIDCRHATRCEAKCEQGGSCTILCNEASTCDSECQLGSLCPRIDCTNTGDCSVKCAAGSTCAIDCRTAVDCREVECETGAQCLLNCGTNENCGFKKCYDGNQVITPVNCGNGVFGCPSCPVLPPTP